MRLNRRLLNMRLLNVRLRMKLTVWPNMRLNRRMNVGWVAASGKLDC